ncbi:MAG: hypothetical protein ACFHWZ_05565 [Phycisphaerales bacterium]
MVSGWGGVVAGGLFPLFVIVLGYTLGRWAWGGWLMFVAVVAYILLASSLVFMSGFEWMRLRNPLAQGKPDRTRDRHGRGKLHRGGDRCGAVGASARGGAVRVSIATAPSVAVRAQVSDHDFGRS